MSMCVLVGHDWQLMRGAGQFKDAEFLVCQACGKTEPVTTERQAHAVGLVNEPASVLPGHITHSK